MSWPVDFGLFFLSHIFEYAQDSAIKTHFAHVDFLAFATKCRGKWPVFLDFGQGYIGDSLGKQFLLVFSLQLFNGQQSTVVAQTKVAQFAEWRRLVPISTTDPDVFPMLGMRG